MHYTKNIIYDFHRNLLDSRILLTELRDRLRKVLAGQ
jgi:hypothetical protein